MAGEDHPKVPVTVLDGTDMRPSGVGEIDVDEVRTWLGVKGMPRAVIVIVADKGKTP